MPAIIVNHDPAGINGRDVHAVGPGVRLLDWLIDEYGPDGFTVPTVVYSNQILRCCEIDLSQHSEDGRPIKEGETIYLVHTPLGLDPLTIAIFIVAAVVGYYVSTLVEIPSIPAVEQPTESPNNSLTGQRNIARPLQRIPDIYGKNKVYPDLIVKSYFEFINNVKFLTEYLCIGRGEYLVELIKSGDTLISDISGSTAEVFGPSVIKSGLLDVEDANAVNGQELTAGGQPIVDIVTTTAVEFVSPSTIGNLEMSEFSGALAGQTLVISGASKTVATISTTTAVEFVAPSTIGNLEMSAFSGAQLGETITISGTPSNDGVYTVSSFTTLVNAGPNLYNGPGIIIQEASLTTEQVLTAVAMDLDVDNDGVYTVSSFTTLVNAGPNLYNGPGIIIQETSLITAQITTAVTMDLKVNASTNEVGPFAVPGGEVTEIWIDLQAPQGLRFGDAGTLNVLINMSVQEVDSVGTPIGAPTVTGLNIQGTGPTALFKTFKVAVSEGFYEVTLDRFTSWKVVSGSLQLTKWARLAGVKALGVTDFGEVTTVYVQTQATEQATSAQDRKFNAIVTRKLVTYDTGTQTVSATPLATAKMADAALNILTDPFMGNKPVSEIDLDQLYAVQDALDVDPIYGDVLGRFCYSLSNDKTVVKDELNTCLNTARCFFWREGATVKFARDEEQPIRKTLFNRRNKKPDGERKAINFRKPSDNDGVSLEWVSEDSGDGFTVLFPEVGSPTNPLRVKAPGIKNYDQAWNRTNYEWLKLLHQRTRVNTAVTKDGLLIAPNDRVANVDGTAINTQDGEIVAVSSLVLGTNESIDFQGNPTGTVILRGEEGEASSPIVVSPRFDGVNGFVLASTPPFDILVRGDNGNQIGSLYDFAPDSNHLATDYLIQEISPDGDSGYINLSLVNYSAEIYAPDTTTPTPQGS